MFYSTKQIRSVKASKAVDRDGIGKRSLQGRRLILKYFRLNLLR